LVTGGGSTDGVSSPSLIFSKSITTLTVVNKLSLNCHRVQLSSFTV